MKEIPLTQGKVALVDNEDYEYLKLFKWYAKETKNNWYAVRVERINKHSMRGMKYKKKGRQRGKTIRMHNVIMKPPEGTVVHHRLDGLNNRRCNMLICTEQQNNQYATDKRMDDNYIPF